MAAIRPKHPKKNPTDFMYGKAEFSENFPLKNKRTDSRNMASSRAETNRNPIILAKKTFFCPRVAEIKFGILRIIYLQIENQKLNIYFGMKIKLRFR